MKKICTFLSICLIATLLHAAPRQTNIVVDVVGSTSTNSTLVLAAEITGAYRLAPIRVKWGVAPYGTNVAWSCGGEIATNSPSVIALSEAIIGPTGNSPGASFNDELGVIWQGPLYLRSTEVNGCRAIIWLFYK